MTGKPEHGGNWNLATWKGSRQQQHREFHALPFSRKLELIQEMSELAAQLGGASKPTESSAALHEESKPYKSRSKRK
jgi:hypothetical protein